VPTWLRRTPTSLFRLLLVLMGLKCFRRSDSNVRFICCRNFISARSRIRRMTVHTEDDGMEFIAPVLT